MASKAVPSSNDCVWAGREHPAGCRCYEAQMVAFVNQKVARFGHLPEPERTEAFRRALKEEL